MTIKFVLTIVQRADLVKQLVCGKVITDYACFRFEIINGK
jgi:hypothetical protein